MNGASRFDSAPRMNGHGQDERPLNPWLLLAAGVLVVLLLVLFA
jgi:hypothetical protein